MHIRTWRLTTDPLGDDPTTEQIIDRCDQVVAWAVARATTSTVLAVVEGPSLRSKHGQPDERGFIRWSITRQLVRHGIPVARLPPSTAKKYVAGHGHADKEAVRRAVHAAWPSRGLNRVSYDEADAVAMATCGVDYAGWPGPWLAGRRGASLLTAVRWPDRTTIPNLET
jgi:hypothetical protein